jgi:hypothetical protein
MQNLYFKVILKQPLIIKKIAAAHLRLAMTGSELSRSFSMIARVTTQFICHILLW